MGHLESASSRLTVVHEMDDMLGASLKKLRLAAGMTQEELAERAGISARTVSDVERGLRSVVHHHTAGRLASALGLADEQRRKFDALARGREMDPAPAPPAGRLPQVPTPLLGRSPQLAPSAPPPVFSHVQVL